MCGILGAVLRVDENLPHFEEALDSIAHRGPDDAGEYHEGRYHLGHRRLSILDPSPAGHQPFVSPCGNIILVYNGECYNHLQLRKELGSVHWKSQCDTETLLHLYLKYGPDFISRVDGMFALAIADKRSGKVYLYRDRFGEKPLYYTSNSKGFFFSSELKALKMMVPSNHSINTKALNDFFLFNYIPEPETVYDGIYKVPPASCILFKEGLLKNYRFWKLKTNPEYRRLCSEEVYETFEGLVESEVSKASLSDVPVGVFLSGGIDSTLVTTALQRSSSSKVSTFTIGFNEGEYDESKKAKQIADYLGTNHHEYILESNDFAKLIPQLPGIWDEPFADASMLPTLLLAQFTSKTVKVALTGDGGDETHLGYDRYRWANQVARHHGKLPHSLRLFAASLLRLYPGYRSTVVSRGLRYSDPSLIYPYTFIGWNDHFRRNLLRKNTKNYQFEKQAVCIWNRKLSSVPLPRRAGFTDLNHYLPGDLLVKVDRAAMSASLETRCPLLSHHLVEFLYSVRLKFVHDTNRPKPLMRRWLSDYLPKKLWSTPKKGFAVPLKHWFRGPWRELLHDSLCEVELAKHDLFDKRYVARLLSEHQDEKANHERQLWALLMFQHWYNRWIKEG